MCHFWHWELYDYSLLCASWKFAHRSNKDIPAWSLGRLLEILQPMMENQNEITIPFDNIFNQIIDCIEWLIKEGYFPKEYLV